MAIISTRRHNWSLDVDDEYHRTYTLESLVRTDDKDDGPFMVGNAAGLPLVGSAYWAQGNSAGYDTYAICWPTMKIRLYQNKPGDPGKTWLVSQKFSTRLPEQSVDIQNPLALSPKYSGSNVTEIVNAKYDKDDEIIVSSSWESFPTIETEYKVGRPTVQVQHNSSVLNLGYITSMVKSVNNSSMWGLPKRTIQLANFSWEKKWHKNYFPYYTRTLDFEINYDTFDIVLADQGTKALGHRNETTGAWVVEGDSTDPDDFTAYKDKDGNPGRVYLNGSGAPATSEETIATITIDHYPEVNFFSIGGIPTFF